MPALVGAATFIVSAMAVPTADAKSPGSRYCFHGYCHRVGSLAQTDTLVGWRGYVQASYYDSCHRDRLNPCGLTSSGAVFRADLPDNAASPLLPDGTVILAYNPKTGDASVLRVTNAGPYSGERKLDVSRAAADKLGFRKQGVAGLVISVLQSPTKAEASYARRRVYPLVPGYLGKFATVDAAIETAEVRFDLREGEELVDDTAGTAEVAALENELVPRPQLAVSPSLASELVILRAPPRPASPGPRLVQGPRLASREVQLVEGPRLVSRADFMAQQSPAEADAPTDFTSRLLRYLLPASAPAAGN
ncbi:septal ring lytic transglycosylase RlpA family protein [Hyphomicrobium album]|uniref:septal ring lytic transglycosylase RlpA family protein n=1 Tax=Hyphomicrobium album TaxID=2665159 RepID=UPI001E30C89C|nr:septal ring lytic transglycosylase RlpA family protein [Hyphomicrobium album]